MTNAAVAIWNEFGEMASNVQVEATTAIEIVSKNGDIVIPISRDAYREIPSIMKEKKKAIVREMELSMKDILELPFSNVAKMNYRSFLKLIDNDIKTISYQSPEMAVTLVTEIIKSFRETSDDLLGLAVIDPSNSDYIVNITHPIIAFLVSIDVLKLPKNGKIVVYKQARRIPRILLNDYNIFEESIGEPIVRDSNDSPKKITFSRYYNESKKRGYVKKIRERSREYWESLLPILAKHMVFNTKVQKYRMDFNAPPGYASALYPVTDINNQYAVKLHAIDDNKSFQDRCYYIPLQVLGGGFAAPYIGDVFVDYIEGQAIMAYGSTGNIKARYRGRHEEIDTAPISDICTGNFNYRTFRGLQTLSKINVSSVFYEQFVDLHHIDLLQAGCDVACDLLEIAKSRGQ